MAKPSENPAAAAEANASIGRRSFLKRLSAGLGWTAFVAWLAGLSAASARFFFPRIRYEPPTRFPVGHPGDYLVDTVDARWLKERGIFVVRNSEGIYVLRAACTHLGCNISWFRSEGWFKCPCHGSFFDVNGDVIGGPAPEPLYRAAVRLDLRGDIQVDVADHANEPGRREKEDFLLRV